MTDLDLLTILVSPGTRACPGEQVAKCILSEVGSVRRLTGRRPGELASLPGMGFAKACRVLAAVELGRRSVGPASDGPTLARAADVHARCARLACESDETFVALAVNGRNRVVGEWVVARGWESGVNLLPRQVFTLLVKEGVGRVVFVHNHPSGDPTPSPEDVRFTRRLLEAARTLDIRVLDHVVVAADGFASIREHARTELEFG